MSDQSIVTTASIPSGWPRFQQWRLLAVMVACVIATIVALRIAAALQPAEVPAPPSEPGLLRVTPDQYAALKITVVTPTGIGTTARASGVIAVDDNHSTPVLPPYSGQVMQVLVQPGQRVVKGQPLLIIRAPEFVDSQNSLTAASAARATAASQLNIAQAAATRAEAIYKTAGGALKDYQSAQNDLAVARAAVLTADASFAAARGKLTVLGKTSAEIDRLGRAQAGVTAGAETTLRAPIGGIIASRTVAVGQYLASGGTTPVFVITDPGLVWLVAQLPESASAQVLLGDAVSVTTPAFPGRTFAAKVDNIGASLDPATHRLPVRATIRNPDGALKPQMFASFIIRTPPSRASSDTGGVSVPAGAVIHEGDSARVWVAGPGRILRARTVTLGQAGDGMVVVTHGLASGERIVTAGAIFVNEAGLPG
jgi:cobalt-zinc-cadmium efflux system membrane fusion protein